LIAEVLQKESTLRGGVCSAVRARNWREKNAEVEEENHLIDLMSFFLFFVSLPLVSKSTTRKQQQQQQQHHLSSCFGMESGEGCSERSEWR